MSLAAPVGTAIGFSVIGFSTFVDFLSITRLVQASDKHGNASASPRQREDSNVLTFIQNKIKSLQDSDL